MKRISGLKFCGFGRATGDLAVTNEDMEHFVDTSDEWIQSRTGIHSRYYAHSRSNAEMAVEAAEKAMREAKRTLKPDGLYILFDTGIGGVGA